MADAENGLKFLEGGVGMLLDVDLKLLRVEFAPMAPTLFGGQRSGARGIQIPINGTPRQIKTPGGLGFGAARLDEFHHPFPQVQCIGFHARKLITLCPNVNMKCYIRRTSPRSGLRKGRPRGARGFTFRGTPSSFAPPRHAKTETPTRKIGIYEQNIGLKRGSPR